MTEIETAQRQRFIESIRKAADFLEQFPEIPVRTVANLFVPCNDPSEVRGKGYGLLRKIAGSDTFYFIKDFGNQVELNFTLKRDQICKKVKVGEKIVAATEEKTIPATPEHVEEIFEWQCPDSIS